VPRPRTIPFEAPWTWLAAGWRDLCRQPALSLGYGAAFTLGSLLIVGTLTTVNANALFLVLAGGFMLIGPFVAVGLYDISRRLAAGGTVTLKDVVRAGAAAPTQLAYLGAFLMLLLLLWVRTAFLIMMLFLGTGTVPPPEDFMRFLLFTPNGITLLVFGTAVGAVFAAVVYASSCVAVPMLLDRKIDALTAARASAAAVFANIRPMALRAALIVVMMAAGFATLLIGLVVAFPLIGHATWHAYRDLFAQHPEPLDASVHERS
jgi:uncharacterized membrane protein